MSSPVNSFVRDLSALYGSVHLVELEEAMDKLVNPTAQSGGWWEGDVGLSLLIIFPTPPLLHCQLTYRSEQAL